MESMPKLRENREYEFQVRKKLVTPDQSEHFVLSGPDQKKYLIPAGRYPHYNIKVGERIICRVDKLNCKGEIFLEPRNPFYTRGNNYFFEVIDHEKRTEFNGIDKDVLIVTDHFGERIPVSAEGYRPVPEIGTKIRLRVEKISKGKIYLSDLTGKRSEINLRANSEYEFSVERISKGMDNEEYFIIKDPLGKIHSIAKRYYDYYGLKPGSKFKAKIIKDVKNGRKSIEPVNPYYRKGTIITVNVEHISVNSINSLFNVELKDKYGFTHCLETSDPPGNEIIKCRVSAIKKGKPILVIM